MSRRVSLAALVLLVGTPAFGQNRATAWMADSKVFTSKYYVVRTDFPESEALAYAAHMDRTCDAYIAMFRGLRVVRPARLSLFMFQHQEDYAAVLPVVFKANATGSQGMCISRGSDTTLVGWRGRTGDDRFRSLLQHEGFHQFARLLFPKLPVWANEGLAEVFERGEAIDGTVVPGQVRERDRRSLDQRLKQNAFVPFAAFFALDGQRWNAAVRNGEAAGVNYLQAWSMVHFFLYAEEGAHRPAFLKFLVLLNQGAKPEQAWVAGFGLPNFAAMEAKWAAYVKGLRPEDYRTTIRRLEFLAAGVMHLRENDVTAYSVDELRSELSKVEFVHTSELFGESVRLAATDASNFSVPGGTATFVFTDVRGRPIDPERPPRSKAPLRIATTGMQAQNFAVTWKRKGRDYVPTFGVN